MAVKETLFATRLMQMKGVLEVWTKRRADFHAHAA